MFLKGLTGVLITSFIIEEYIFRQQMTPTMFSQKLWLESRGARIVGVYS